MTLNQLHKLLGKLIQKGYGRAEVCIDKPSFRHNLEADGVVYQDICGARAESYEICDGDGFIATRKDGSARMKTGVLLYGIAGCAEGKSETQS